MAVVVGQLDYCSLYIAPGLIAAPVIVEPAHRSHRLPCAEVARFEMPGTRRSEKLWSQPRRHPCLSTGPGVGHREDSRMCLGKDQLLQEIENCLDLAGRSGEAAALAASKAAFGSATGN